MPAPDIAYFLDGCLDISAISGDTHYYFFYQEPNTNEIIDSCPSRYTLFDTGNHCEEKYLQYRSQPDSLYLAASHSAYESFGSVIEQYINDLCARIENTDKVTATLANDNNFIISMDVQKRAIGRIYEDLEGYSPEKIQEGLLLSNQVWDVYKTGQIEQLADLRRVLRGSGIIESNERSLKGAQNYLKRKIKEDRRILNRSIKFASRLLGDETIRVFLGGQKIRVDGRHCVYEIVKSGGSLEDHGASTLRIFTKEDDIHLCDICIQTPDVPLLDHVSGMIISIQAGEEDEILKIGNAYNIKDDAYNQSWLTPYLPSKVVENAWLFNLHQERLTNQIDKTVFNNLRKEVSQVIFDHLGQNHPPIPYTKAALLGLPMPD